MKSSASTSSTPDCRPTAQVALQIKDKARASGLDLVGNKSAQARDHAGEFQGWLASDFHGEMGYMAKNVQKRADPSQILPDARSIVVVGMNHYTGDHDR